MAALALAGGPGSPGPRRSKPRITMGQAAAAGGLILAVIVVWNLTSAELVSKRPQDMKTTQVVLPPPPPPPPPPPKPMEKPPEPTPMDAPADPVDTPPPPDQAQSSEPTTGDNALTAREGAGPSNYGLAGGDGSGGRIGGRPGGSGNGFAAYASVALSGIRQAAQSDRDLSRGRYTVQLAVTVDAEGRITDVRVLGGGDEKRNARLRQVLAGLRLSQRPPAGMPVMRIELNARSGA